MLHVGDLLRTPAGRWLTLVAGPWDARPVEGVVLVDDPGDLERVPGGAVCVLSRDVLRAGVSVTGLLRTAGERGLAGLVLPGSSGTSPAVVDLARRVRVALLAGAFNQRPADLAAGLREVVRSDPELLLRRTRDAVERLGAVEGAGEEVILAAASEAVGVAYGVADLAESAATSAVIRVDGRADGYVRWADDDPAAAIVAGVVAAMLGRVRAAARAAEQARAAALLALMRAPAGDLPAAARRARLGGVPVDGRHVAVFLRPDRPPAAVPSSPWSADDLGGGSVLATPWQDGLLVVRTVDEPPGRGEDPMEAARLGESLPAGLVAGLGTCQRGPEGLRRTAAQARTAAGRAAPGEVAAFDRLGVHAVLAELTASDSAVLAARDMLAPLGRLGALAPHAVPTLKAYLDTWGSRTKAAAMLNLHPNAVAHRVRRITEVLDLDLADPQTRFALQLACHVLTETGA
ncbi:PucR family transcriptional regulator [Sphaerisporangium fuscum]|uniref:PucR family transcriptional regulator n=1 Tax=Sphaerisporangium fuscum TaxID=2835868 RepID=UPI001BDC43A4|nr:helix-turn-helix domain-containing protein [Sphaerisporangium fuscum]